MPWVRIDENAMDHPKIGALPDGAFRLWVQALAYCQKHLTDGFVSDRAIRSLLAFSPKRRENLIASGLWDRADGGITVHDYLEWNDSRDVVLGKRETAKARMKSARERARQRSPERAREVLRGVVCSNEEPPASEEKEGGPGETAAVDETTRRVRWFVDRYQELHEKYLGVAYLGNPVKDYQAACELVAAFDDELLEKIAVYGLNDPDPFMARDTRTLTKLRGRASGYVQALRRKKLA